MMRLESAEVIPTEKSSFFVHNPDGREELAESKYSSNSFSGGEGGGGDGGDDGGDDGGGSGGGDSSGGEGEMCNTH